MEATETPLPRKRWRFRGLGPFVVAMDHNGMSDVYRGAQTIEGARRARREVPHWHGAYIWDQARGVKV